MKFNEVKYYVGNEWVEKGNSTRRDVFKEVIYSFMRPLLSIYCRQHLSRETLKKFKPSFVLPERGLPHGTRRLWMLKMGNICNIREATILIQGVGTGWEIISWAKMRPKKIIGVDLVNFSETWNEISKYCQEQLSVQIEFRQGSLENLSFIGDSSIDLCASEAVYEHCRDLNSVLKESHRILKPGGVLFAAYGPLWFSSGGDHFSGRGGLHNSFNHLLLDPGEYADFINNFSYAQEECQDGRRYVEIDLFSKLKTQEYLDLLRVNGFKITKLIFETSSKSLAFKNKHPDLFSKLIDKYRHRCSADDFLIKSNIVFCNKI